MTAKLPATFEATAGSATSIENLNLSTATGGDGNEKRRHEGDAERRRRSLRIHDQRHQKY